MSSSDWLLPFAACALRELELNIVIVDFTVLLRISQNSVDALDDAFKASEPFFDGVVAGELGFEKEEATVDQLLADF